MSDNNYLILMDVHLKDDNTELIKDIFNQAIIECKKRNINTIFQGGDIFNSRSALSLKVLSTFINILDLLEENDITVYSISGNHDKVDQESENSYLSIFSRENFIVFEKETTLSKLNSEYDYHFIPYFKENGSYKSRLENIVDSLNQDKKHVLITHIAVEGVRNNDGSVVSNSITTDLFRKFESVFVGHYHNSSNINNIKYLGSTYQASFGEDDKKGFHVLTNGTTEFIKTKFPEYIKIRINVDNTDMIKELSEKYSNSTDNIRFILEGDEVKLASFDKSIFIDMGIDIKFEKNILLTEINESENTKIYDRSNIKDAFGDFCDVNKYENDEISSKYLNLIL